MRRTLAHAEKWRGLVNSARNHRLYQRTGVLLAIWAAVLVACTRSLAEPPTTVTTAKPSIAPSMVPSLTLFATHTPMPELLATPQPVSTPTSSVTSPPNAEVDSIALFMSFIGSHQFGDKFYFHTIVLDKNAEFVPKTVQIIDPTTNETAGPFNLVERPGFHFCAHLAWTGGKFYETNGIDISQLPSNFWHRLMSDPFVYRITVQKPTGVQESVDILEPPGICESSSSSSTDGNSVLIGMSFIGSHQFGDKYYFHVSVRDKDAGFVPVAIEAIDPTTHQVVGGPFMLREKDSLLCRNKIYETDEFDPSQLPADFWYLKTVEPYYIYRVTVRESTGEQKVLDIVDRPFICESSSE